MKRFLYTSFLLVSIVLTSCSSVDVATDYDRSVDFDNYQTYAFYKPGVDKAKISDLDKRRILRAIDDEMNKMGYTKTKESPDLLVSFFTETEKNVDIYRDNFGYGWGYGYGPFYGSYYNNYPSVSTSTEGTLFIDFVDKKSMNLVWQGMGKGVLNMQMNEKIKRINEMVEKIMERYPPEKKENK